MGEGEGEGRNFYLVYIIFFVREADRGWGKKGQLCIFLGGERNAL